MEDKKALKVTIESGIAKINLLGPSKGNAMGPDFFREIPIVFQELDQDDSVRVIIVSGSGDNFSYGLDLGAMMADLGPYLMGPQMAKKRTKLLELIHEFQKSGDAVERCRKPVIAAIDGWCIGGGLDLAAASDIRLCTQKAQFSLREVKVAIVADLGSLHRLPSIIGEGATRELAFTGKNINADRALSIGLVSEVFEDGEALQAAAHTMAIQIAENPPLVVQGIKQVMNFSSSGRVREGLDFVAVWNSAFLQSMDLMEAFTAFREKRPPKYQGK